MLSYGFCFQVQVEPQVSEDERKKYEQEFSDYQKKLEQAKEEWVGLKGSTHHTSPELLFIC